MHWWVVDMKTQWQDTPPDSEGLWWLYGDPQFGSMGGHYTGSILFEPELHVITVQKISNGLMAHARGQFINLRPFDKRRQLEGYIGKWARVNMPELPTL